MMFPLRADPSVLGGRKLLGATGSISRGLVLKPDPEWASQTPEYEGTCLPGQALPHP